MSDKLRVHSLEGVKVSYQAKEVIETTQAMARLELPKAFEFEIDDGEEGQALVESLLVYLEIFEGHLLRVTNRIEEIASYDGAGKFLFYLH